MAMLKEFREFAMRGNVVDMAVGIIIGAAFGKIVASLVADVIMPPISILLGNVDFTEWFITLSSGSYETLAAAQEAGAATLNVGLFINAIVNFVIIAFAVFLLIRAINQLKRKEEAAPAPAPTTKDCPYCLSAVPLKATRCGHCTSDLTAG
jgi:large conductance mechanosensitive channel